MNKNMLTIIAVITIASIVFFGISEKPASSNNQSTINTQISSQFLGWDLSTDYSKKYYVDEFNPRKISALFSGWEGYPSTYQLTSLEPIPNNIIHTTTFIIHTQYAVYPDICLGIITEKRKQEQNSCGFTGD